MEFKIVKANPDHIDQIINTADKFWKVICPDNLDEDDRKAILEKDYNAQVHKNVFDNNDAWSYVMLADDQVVGFCHLKRKSEETNIAVFERFIVLPEYHNYKQVYKLFQPVVKIASLEGITEIEINIPSCAKDWIGIFIDIGLEFETWRSFEAEIGSKILTIWPGLLVIVPGC